MWVEAMAAALVGISLLWLVFEPVFTTGGPSVAGPLDLDGFEDLEDTRSGVALAALKEIEFDRETGKLSDADYEFLKQKYTVEALEALRAEDAAPGGFEPGAAPPTAAAPAAGAGPQFCAHCGRPLSSGSRFCGDCGGRVAA